MEDIHRYIHKRLGLSGIIWAICTSRGLHAVTIFRIRNWISQKYLSQNQIVKVFLKVILSFTKLISVILAKAEIHPLTEIKPGLFISNKGNVIIGADRIGSGCVIRENVTIGRNLATKGKATIGDHVWIGADTVISGNISIGSGATIRAGSVLTKSIPSNSVVQGNPARVIKKDFDNWQLISNPFIDSKLIFEY